MKSPFRSVLPGLSLFLVLVLALGAQESPAPKSAPPPAAAPAPAEPGAPVPATPPVEAATPPADGELRRIDADTAPEAPTKRSSGQRKRARADAEMPMGDHTIAKDRTVSEAVSILGSTTVLGTVKSDAVSVLGDTTVEAGGKVGGATVAVLGRIEMRGEANGKVVSVLGGAYIDGPVGGEVVSVLGGLELGPNAVVDGDIVLVGGKLKRDPKAVLRGNMINVPVLGGVGEFTWLVTWVKECVFYARPLAFKENLGWAWNIALALLAFYTVLGLLFGRAIEKCATTLETRPGFTLLASVLTVLLTPVAMVLLAVTVIGAIFVPFLAVGLFFAGLFGKAVMLAVIGRRITRHFGDGPLGHAGVAVLIGGLITLLLYTIPVFGFLFYKLTSWLGLGVVVYTIALGMKREKSPAGPVAGGGTPDPVAPMATAGVANAAATATPSPANPIPATAVAAATAEPTTSLATPPPVAAEPPAAPRVSPGFGGGEATSGLVAGAIGGAGGGAESPAPAAEPPPNVPPVMPAAAAPLPPLPPLRPRGPMISAHTQPRAGFMIRLGAMAIDGVLVGMIIGFTSDLMPRFLQFHHGPGGLLLAMAIYGAVMWKTKGTTIGGIVCGLKVVRIDDRELDWATAVVRALGCFLSLFVAGLGFLWVLFDDERQSWHDKIAGTTIVRVPKGVSLL